MKKFLETLGDIFLGENQTGLELRELQIQFICDKETILKHIRLCKKSRGLIGVYSDQLGKGMFLAAIEHILPIENDVLVILKPYGASMDFDKKTSLPLNDISRICPFNQIYSEPVMQNNF